MEVSESHQEAPENMKHEVISIRKKTVLSFSKHDVTEL